MRKRKRWSSLDNKKIVIDERKKRNGNNSAWIEEQTTKHVILMQSISVTFQVDKSLSVYLTQITFACRSLLNIKDCVRLPEVHIFISYVTFNYQIFCRIEFFFFRRNSSFYSTIKNRCVNQLLEPTYSIDTSSMYLFIYIYLCV